MALKGLCKCQVDKPMNARVTAVQIYSAAMSFAHHSFFPYNIIENFPNYLTHKSVFIGPNDFKFGTETSCMVLRAISKFGAN